MIKPPPQVLTRHTYLCFPLLSCPIFKEPSLGWRASQDQLDQLALRRAYVVNILAEF